MYLPQNAFFFLEGIPTTLSLFFTSRTDVVMLRSP